MNIKIIKQGNLTIDVFETPSQEHMSLKKKLGTTGTSTVTLIQGAKNLLVDTGFENEEITSKAHREENQEKLKTILSWNNLEPEDIDLLFLTHLHRDHYGNMQLFKDTEILLSKKESEGLKVDNSKVVKDNQRIMKCVKVLYTPGHKKGHASLIVNFEGKKIVVAGDAVVSRSYYGKNTVYNYNILPKYALKEALISQDKISTIADYIIPGHEGCFWNFKKESQIIRDDKTTILKA